MGLNSLVKLVFVLTLLLSSQAMAQDFVALTERMLCNVDKFDKFPVAVEKNIKSKKIDFSSYPQLTAKQREDIQTVYGYGPNFNDHYTITGWNEDCFQSIMIDNTTGKIIFSLPEAVRKNGIKACSRPFFRQSSNLILFDASCKKSYTPKAVIFENGKFTTQKLAKRNK